MVGRKRKKKHLKIFARELLDKGFKRDWSVSLGAMLDDGHTENKKKSSFRDFPGRSTVLCCGFRM